MNKLLDGLKDEMNFGLTENGAVKHLSTRSAVLDMFAMGAAMRDRTEEDIILMFRKAMAENTLMALRCLFYIRDIRGGQGERRFFRICIKDLAFNNPAAAIKNIQSIATFGRWDDLYSFVGTPVERAALTVIKDQLELDLTCKTPSLLAKWLKSENASSKETARLGGITRKFLGLSHKEYRQILSTLRNKIKIVETLMSQNRWSEIEFDKIPSKAGLKYKNVFARKDIIAEKFEKFAADANTTVKTGAIYPYEVVEKVLDKVSYDYGSYNTRYKFSGEKVDRDILNKYWENLKDYFDGKECNMLCMIDTSGSMCGTPINTAISLGLYVAERMTGPFANHYMSFASRPQLIETNGVDFVDKVLRIYETNLVDDTNIEAAFDLILKKAIAGKLAQSDLPSTLTVISDMEFNSATSDYSTRDAAGQETLMEGIAKKWSAAGYEMPHLIFWNVNARTNNIPMLGNGRISFVSGMSPTIFEAILTGKSGMELFLEAVGLNPRYAEITD